MRYSADKIRKIIQKVYPKTKNGERVWINDRLVIKQESDVGPTRFDSNYVDDQSDSRIKYFHGIRVIPYLDYSDCVLSAGHKLIIELWRQP